MEGNERADVFIGVRDLVADAYFYWPHLTGRFGSCVKWMDTYYDRIKATAKHRFIRGYLSGIERVGWDTEWGGGHNAVRITLPGGDEYYFDDGNLGGFDQIFGKNDIPSHYEEK